MKRSVIVTAVLISTVVTASADQLNIKWYDTIRSHGHRRSDALGHASIESCNKRVGVPDGFISPAFKTCMRGFGYRFVSSHLERTPAPKRERSVVTYNRYSPDPDVGWHTDENGFRQCQHDCDNPEIPGSGYTCRSVEFMGRAMRQCDK